MNKKGCKKMRIHIRRFVTNQPKKNGLKGVFIEPHLRELMQANVIDKITAKTLSAMECILSN